MTTEMLDVPQEEVEEIDPALLDALVRAVRKAAPRNKAALKIKELASGAGGKAIFVVSSKDPFVSEALQSIIPRLPEIIRARRKELTDRELDVLVDLLLPDDPMRGVLRDIELDNIALRQRFLGEWPCRKSREIHRLSGAKGSNVSQTASRWKRDAKIFALPVGREDLYPIFQFQDGKPHPTIARVLEVFGSKLSPWQVAFWFVAENGWLDGARPVDLLGEPDALVEAATHEVEEPRH